MNNNKIIIKLLITTFFSLFFWISIVYALSLNVVWIAWNSWNNYQDKYLFNSTSNSNISVELVNDNLKRIIITQNEKTWTWILYSELFWNFYIEDKIFFTKDQILNTQCNTISYSLSWTLVSTDWWYTIPIHSDSYFCPLSKELTLVIESELTWEITLIDNTWNFTISTINSRWDTTNISSSDIFDDKKISITWLNNIEDNSWMDSEIWNSNKWIQLTSQVEWSMMNFNKSVNKNIISSIKWISPTTTNSQNLIWFSNRVHYYNFEWTEEAETNWNKWVTLEIWDTNNSMLRVSWHKFLYIKWWNIYINADIYNNSNASQLVIVVRRDGNNRQNWWNVYIDPSVTNIDATIIADWSIISYNWSNILNSENNPWNLPKQLLIYWSISTKNTFWENTAIYWTDEYVANWWNEITSNKYNLALLRNFQTTTSNWRTWDCSDENKIISVDTNNNAIKEAFAWKKDCYISDATKYWLDSSKLRSTEKLAPLVIEYNPMIQTDPHFILKK